MIAQRTRARSPMIAPAITMQLSTSASSAMETPGEITELETPLAAGRTKSDGCKTPKSPARMGHVSSLYGSNGGFACANSDQPRNDIGFEVVIRYLFGIFGQRSHQSACRECVNAHVHGPAPSF